MKKDQDIEAMRTTLKKQLTQKFERNPWDRFKDFLGVFFIAVFLLICFAIVSILGVYLLENPVSLAILCWIILLIIIWSPR